MTDDVASPLDRSLAAGRPTASYKGGKLQDYHMQQNKELRAVDPVPVDYHPGAIRGESSGAVAADQTLTGLYEAWATIQKAADSGAPIHEVGALGERALSKALAASDKTIGTLTVREQALEIKIREIVQPKISDSFAGEIRTYVRQEVTDRSGKLNMSRLSKITSAAKEDKRIASAILEAPAILSGLTGEALGVFRGQIVDHYAYDTQAELLETQRARQHLEKARNRAIETLGPKIASWKERTPDAHKKLRELA